MAQYGSGFYAACFIILLILRTYLLSCPLLNLLFNADEMQMYIEIDSLLGYISCLIIFITYHSACLVLYCNVLADKLA